MARRFSGVVHNSTDGGLIYLPLEEVSVNTLIVDVSARVTLSQVFTNDSQVPTPRAKYVFPVPASAAVCAFEMRTDDGRVITGVAKEKTQAAAEHEQAVTAGKLTSLVEWATDDIFTISIGSIPAGQTITTTLTYIMDLMTADCVDQVRFYLPMSVGERYGKLPDVMVDSSAPSPRTRIKIKANIQTKGAIQSVTSPSHPTISVDSYQNHRGVASARRKTIKFRSSDFLSQDFILSIKAEGLDEPRCFAERDPNSGSSVAMQLTLVPKFDLPPVRSQEYIFLIDRSGSMSGAPIETAKRTMVALLRALPSHGTTFNIFSFGSHYESIFRTESSVTYNQGNLAVATSSVDAMKADFGGTEIRNALDHVLRSRNPSTPTAVFVLTDGEAYDIDDTIATVAHAVAQSSASAPLRVFTLGIGEQISTAMCEGIARAGNGLCLFATNAESILGKCAKLVRAGRTFVLKNVSVDWGVPPDMLIEQRSGSSVRFAGEDAVVRQAPSQIDSIYPGHRLILSSIVNSDTFKVPRDVTLRGQRDGQGEVIEIKIPVEHIKFTSDEPRIPLIHTLAARRLITDLQDKKLHGSLTEEQKKSAIIRLGEQYSLASEYTSFVAVEGQTGSERRRMNMSTRSLRRRSSINTLEEEEEEAAGTTTVTDFSSFVQVALDYTSSFVSAFIETWFTTRPPPPRPINVPGGYRSSIISVSGSDVGFQEDEAADDEDDEHDTGAESDATFTTLSSLLSHSDSEWSDFEEPPSRGRSASPPPPHPNAREPSPDFARANSQAPLSPSGSQPGNGGFGPRGQVGPGRQGPGPVLAGQASSSAADEAKVISLIRLQSFDGSFTLSGDFGQIVGRSAVEQHKNMVVNEKLWATALAVAYFRKHLTNQPDLLSGCEEKAMEFISEAGLTSTVEFLALVERAKSIVN